MKWVVGILLASVLLYSVFLMKPKQQEQDLQRIQPSQKRKVVWLMVDSMMAHAIEEGVRNHRLPALRHLAEHGQYHRELVSSFPTMSVTIDSSLFTGTYPDRHRVPGLIWYDEREKRIVNYGTGFQEVLRDGVNPVLKDALIHLNQKHLNPETPTLYEELARRGIQSGSVNGIIYRGTVDHELSFPAWISVPTDLPDRLKVKGPDFFTFGAFSNPLQGKAPMPEGITQSLGFGDEFPLAVTRYLVEHHRLPDFLFVYLSDMDKSLHKKGPSDMSGIEKFDRELQSLLDSFGSWDRALQEVTWIVSGDSGQTGISSPEEKAVVPLDELLNGYNILEKGKPVTKDTEIVLCVNERMAYVYAVHPSVGLRNLVDILRQDDRIDLIAWKEGKQVEVLHAGLNQSLRFRPGSGWTDPYRQQWDAEGDWGALDISADPHSKRITYGEYPDPLMRLWGALHSHGGKFLVVTAKPGCQLAGSKHSPKHPGGGGHGSLHRTDSLAPLIITGTDRRPAHLRIVDMKDFVIELLTQDDHEKGR